MKTRLYTPVYAATLLLSAALLFSVQPMFSKMILPLLGGTPQVWNTAMLFFQVALLAGYAYVHGTAKFLSIRAQVVVHLILLGVFTIALPLGIPADWLPPVAEDPTFWQLSIMAASVGGPFFVLAASAPMLQRWFANTDHPDADNPYFLYGASNLGSISALLLYPVLVEPLLALPGQSNFWMFGYFALIIMVALSALFVWKHAGEKQKDSTAPAQAEIEQVTWRMRLEWVILAFIPSSLMLGVTTFITTDIASAPLIWIIPLALYVGTFIIVFAKKIYVKNRQLAFIQGALIALLILFTISGIAEYKFFMIGLHLLLFTVTAWMCHGILSAKRPDKTHLTEFYLLMSFGGALGGFFNAIIAPQIFVTALEYTLVLAASCFCRFWADGQDTIPDKKNSLTVNQTAYFFLAILAVMLPAFLEPPIAILTLISSFFVFAVLFFNIDSRWSFAGLVALTFFFYQPDSWIPSDKILHSERNFFGIIKVFDDTATDQRILLHGTTNHGSQSLEDAYKLLRISYYSEFSPLDDAFKLLELQKGPQNIAVLGLGSGATSCFSKKDRHFDFFEIDPAIIKIAESPDYFTYLSDCGSPYDIILGDGRMTIQRQPNESYDLILLDVFSSDNIPIHVLTEEAIRIYLSKLKPNGTLIFHISNNFLNLEPVLTETAKKIGIPGYAHLKDGGTLEESNIEYFGSHYFLMTHSEKTIAALEKEGWSAGLEQKGIKSWNDQFSDIFSVIGNNSGDIRAKIFSDKHKAAKEAKLEAQK